MRLIDILNKIANGELKEGTKVIWKAKECWGDIEYTYKDGDLERKVCGETIYVYEEMFSRHLKDEVELIELDHFPDVGKMAEHFREDTKMIEPTECEHEWKRYSLGRLGQRTENHRYCSKCGTDEIEPTDNNKIEELDMNEFVQGNAIDYRIVFKLNEVIRHINKED